ncbi:ABC transporter substrate-binding protein [Peptoniphilus equinus]|uniref:ABC transporter substrate-binding protein n=1 Tax=Peptoniphilus equinus TaxID=3016343 RepID=A0ABY7QUF5_9FIRM|nr:ABC transporter substrate-binding protein [Peptoniphilus equinus]WBW49808.1 ABC transporter substrate-binding protein [Peptoniphilus equinus]
MKKFMHTLAFMSLVVVMIFTTACSESAKQALNTDTANAGEASAELKDGETVEIEFWYGLGSVACETMESLIKEFNESQDKVHVTGVQQADYDETLQKVQAAIAAKQPPAVFIGSDIQKLAEKHIAANMKDYIDDARTPVSDYMDVLIESALVDDGVYAFPAYGTTQVIYYRKDLLEQAGIDPKEMYSSWENVFKYSKELQDKGITQLGHLPMWGADNLMDVAFSNGGTVISEDGKTVTINSKEWVDAWNFIREQIQNGTAKINSGGQGWEYWYRTIDNVMNGEAISYTGSSGDKGDLDFSIIDSAMQPGLNGNPAKPIAGAHYMVVPEIADDAQKAAAYEWIAFFTSPEVSARWSETVGYIPSRKSATEMESYKKFVEENPYAGVPTEQVMSGATNFIDPTGGKITDALKIAADKVELENVDAQVALDEAQKTAQAAWDEYLSK